MPIMPAPLNLLELEAILADQSAKQKEILLARNYFQGKQNANLTNGTREFLGLHPETEFRFNICRTIVTALSGELNLLGFSTDEEEETQGAEESSKPVSDWVSDLFDRNKIDSLQTTVHNAALSDSESFIIVEWDPVEQYPRLIYNPYLIETDAGGDGMGVYMIYENDDPEQRPIAAVKQWIETIYEGMSPYSRRRRTVYYPDHTERWVMSNGANWEHYIEETDQVNEDGERIVLDWWIDNLDSDGSPLGIPVFHFRNEGLRPEHWEAIPMQDAINKSLVDVLAAGDLTAFQSYFGFGFFPTTDGKAPLADGSNLMRMGPAQFNGTMTPAKDASLMIIPGADPTPLMNQFKDLILATAQMSDTPASRFIVTAAIASEKTIKQQERGLRKKGASRRGLFSDPWLGAFDMARKLSNLYGSAGISEEIALSPLWEHTETLEELSEKKTILEIPIEQIWREAGYTDSQIEQMKRESSYRVKFEAALWAGYNTASQQGVPLELYLKRVGLPKEEISEILGAIRDQAPIPSVGL